MISPDVAAAIISALSAVLVAAIGAWGAKQRKLKKAIKVDRDHTIDVFNHAEFFRDWDSFYWEVLALIDQTLVDRVLILQAENGAIKLTRVTAVNQIRSEGQERVDYKRVPIDEDYALRLVATERDGFIYFDVSKIPQCLIRDIYEAEGVRRALWVFSNSRNLSGGRRRVTFLSFASHQDEDFDKALITRCRLSVGHIKWIS